MTPRFLVNPSPQTPPLRLTYLALMVALGCGGPAHSGDPTDAPMETSDVRAELPDVGGELPDAEQDGKGNPWPEVSHLVFATEFSADQVATDDDVCFGDITGLEGLETGAPFGQARLYFEGETSHSEASTSSLTPMTRPATRSCTRASMSPTSSQAPSAATTRFLKTCLLYTSPSPRDGLLSRMPSSA